MNPDREAHYWPELDEHLQSKGITAENCEDRTDLDFVRTNKLRVDRIVVRHRHLLRYSWMTADDKFHVSMKFSKVPQALAPLMMRIRNNRLRTSERIKENKYDDQIVKLKYEKTNTIRSREDRAEKVSVGSQRLDGEGSL